MPLRMPGQSSQPAPSPGLLPHATGAGVVPATVPAGNPGVTPVVSTPDLVAAVAAEVAGVIAISEHASLANQTADLPNFANSVTGVYGISGSGKTSLIVTAIEFCWEEFEMISLVYATDLGGFGNKMLSLVRNGIARVWDPRNHVNPFETMEQISLGAWPEHIDDVETGKADPMVRLILPRRIITNLVCPQGHGVARFEMAVARDAALFDSGTFPCPTCGVVTSKANGTTQAQVVRHRMFSRVGHRGYDSLTEMNDWGMMRLADMSARGLLPASSKASSNEKGGSLLGSADALREGSVVYGGGSFTHVGFMQNRSYQWIANIRSIPDQVMPATCTFAVEQGKADDDSGGVPILGPQIAGNARTAKVPRWVGNCLHASREPDVAGNMRYRLWLTSHLDSRDVRKIPYLAKHRGIPLDMPDFLEDPWDDDPQKRAVGAWSVCSLGNFYRKLIAQLEKLEAAQREKYKNAPGLKPYEQGDDVIENVSAPAMLAPAAVNAPVAGGQTLSARRTALRVPGAVASPMPGPPPVSIPVQSTPPPVTQAPAPPATSVPIPGGLPAGLVVVPSASGSGTADPAGILQPAAPVPTNPVVPEGPSVLEQQLKASLELRNAATQGTAPVPGNSQGAAATVTGGAVVTPTPAPSRLRQPGALRTPGAAATASAVIAAPPTTVSTVAPPVTPAAAVAPVPTVAPIQPVLPAASMPAPAPPPRLAARRTPRPPV